MTTIEKYYEKLDFIKSEINECEIPEVLLVLKDKKKLIKEIIKDLENVFCSLN